MAFFAWLFGFVVSGYLLEVLCPDPSKLPADQGAVHAAALAGGPMPSVYAHAHYIWYAFAAIGFMAFAMLLVYQFVTSRLDAGQGGSKAA